MGDFTSNNEESPFTQTSPIVHWAGVLGVGVLVAAGIAGIGKVLGPYESGKKGAQGRNPFAGMGGAPPMGMGGMPMMGGDPGMGGVSPQEMWLHRQGVLVQQALQASNYPQAIKLCLDGVSKVEELFGPDNMNMLNFTTTLSRLYDAVQQTDESLKYSIITAKILRKEYENMNEEVTAEDFAPFAESLRSKLLAHDRYTEALEWCRVAQQVREELLSSNPSKQNQLNVAVGLRYLGVCFSRLGRFRDSYEALRKALAIHKKLDPVSNEASNALECLTSSLHQNALTDVSITETEAYAPAAEGYPGSEKFVAEIWSRAGFLLITISDWEGALKLYLKSYDTLENVGLPSPFDVLNSIATVYWEMGESEKALEFEKKIRARKVALSQLKELPYTRSDTLTTLTAHIMSNRYRIDLRINRTRPRRQEGDALEDPDDIERKFNTCYVRVEFENPPPAKKLSTTVATHANIAPRIEEIEDIPELSDEEAKVEDVTDIDDEVESQPAPATESTEGTIAVVEQGPTTVEYEMEVKNYQFTLESPMINTPTPGTWLKAIVHVYSDSTMTKKLGVHHQLVYNIADQYATYSGLSQFYR